MLHAHAVMLTQNPATGEAYKMAVMIGSVWALEPQEMTDPRAIS
jgi:hypothetical protein